MEILKQFLGAVTSWVPANLVLKAGPFTALLVIALFLASLVWQTLNKGLADLLVAWLKEHSRALLLFLFGLPVLACLAAGSLYSSAVMAVIAVTALLLHRKGRLRWSKGGLALVQIAVLALALFVEGRWRERQIRDRNEQVQLYVVLPMQPGSGQSLNQEMLSLSFTLREIVENVFGDLVKVHKVRVEPKQYAEVKDLVEWRKMNAVMEQLSPFEPDIVLDNGVTLFPDDLLAFYIRLKTCSSTAELLAIPGVKPIKQSGHKDHFSLLVLRASLEMFERIRSSGKFDLDPVNVERVHRKILSAYKELLENESEPKNSEARNALAEALEKAEAALAKKTIALVDLQKIVDAYPTGKVLEDRLDGETRSRLGALGHPAALPSDAEEAQSPVTEASAAGGGTR